MLAGHWKDAVTVQFTVLFAEAALWTTAWWLPGSSIAVTICALLIDLLMLSPLKGGRAFFFETLAADGDAATPRLLWRYYRHGYERTVAWRLLLWGQRALLGAVACLPAFLLFAYSGVLAEGVPTRQDTVLSMALFACGLLCLVMGLAAVEILLFRLVPVPYLLSQPGGLREAVNASRRITHGRIGVMTMLYLDHAGWLLASITVFPWLYASVLFHTARAATVRRFLREIPPKNVSHHLQRRKKCGRMGR